MKPKRNFLRVLFLPFVLLLLHHATSQTTTYLSNHPANDRYGRYSPSGEQIVFESDRNGNWDIFLLDKKSGTQTQLTTDTTEDRWPSWHPSEEKILFTSARSGKNRLYEVDLADKEVQKIDMDEALASINFSTYSPDGTSIAFSVEETPNQHNLYLFDLQAQQSRALSKDTLRTLYPGWSPNGKELVFFSRQDTKNEDDEIYRMNIKSGKTQRLTNWPKHNFCPSWSNRGDRIAYVTSMENTRPEIYVMKKNGKKQLRITYNETGDTLPDWSPDDKHLLITTYHEGHYEIAEIKVP